jgi:hypothetical protein
VLLRAGGQHCGGKFVICQEATSYNPDFADGMAVSAWRLRHFPGKQGKVRGD